MSRQQDICSTPDCDEFAKTMGYCPACYSYYLRWNKRTPKDRLRRMTQLSMWNTRFMVMGEPIRIRKKVTARDVIKVMPGEAKYIKTKKLKVVNG